jgi:uncharacterized phiE125 gp8 family phage protein
MIYGNALQLTETVAPTVEPITTAEAKAHMRVDITDEDTLIDTYIEAARQLVEETTGMVFVERTFRLDLPCLDTEIILPKPPLISVSSVQYYDSDNNLQTLASSNYDVDVPGGRILISSTGTYPSTYVRPDAVQITFTAGYESAASPKDYRAPIPERVKAAIKLIVADMNENREASIVGSIRTDNPTVDRLLGPSRTRL